VEQPASSFRQTIGHLTRGKIILLSNTKYPKWLMLLAALWPIIGVQGRLASLVFDAGLYPFPHRGVGGIGCLLWVSSNWEVM
jgi:hypothetical protein